MLSGERKIDRAEFYAICVRGESFTLTNGNILYIMTVGVTTRAERKRISPWGRINKPEQSVIRSEGNLSGISEVIG